MIKKTRTLVFGQRRAKHVIVVATLSHTRHGGVRMTGSNANADDTAVGITYNFPTI